MAEENLAYLAEHDPAGALEEYRRRKGAKPRQTSHAPLLLPDASRRSRNPASAEVGTSSGTVVDFTGSVCRLGISERCRQTKRQLQV